MTSFIKFSGKQSIALQSYQEILDFVAPFIKKPEESVKLLFLSRTGKSKGFYDYKSTDNGHLEYSKMDAFTLVKIIKDIKSEISFSRVIIIRKFVLDQIKTLEASREDFYINNLHKQLIEAASLEIKILEMIVSGDNALFFPEDLNVVEEIEKSRRGKSKLTINTKDSCFLKKKK